MVGDIGFQFELRNRCMDTQRKGMTILERRSLWILAAALFTVLFLNLSLMSNHELRSVGSAIEQHLQAFRHRRTQWTRQSMPRQASIQDVSACLLIKDDNELLNEWIAYHYHTLRLRHLVVAVDPDSRTSPNPVLATWRNLTDLEVTLWSDSDYMPESFLSSGYFISPNRMAADSNRSRWLRIPTCNKVNCTAVSRSHKLRIANHRFRQVTFLSECFKHHRAQGRTWVMHIDTDEYLVLNRHKRQGELHGVEVPNSMGPPDGIFQYVKQLYQDDFMHAKMNWPCVSLPRVLFGAVEHGDVLDHHSALTSLARDFDLRRFETLRWWYHAHDEDKERNGQPKVMIDVSSVPENDEMMGKLFSIHRPSKALCRTFAQADMSDYVKFPLAVAHYLGPWDRYNARNDSRRTDELYRYKSNVHGGPDYFMKSWLQGFVANVGSAKAHILLKDYMTGAQQG